MLQRELKIFLGLVTSALVWLSSVPKMILRLFSRRNPADEIEITEGEVIEENKLPQGYDVQEETRKILQGFEEMAAKWITNIHLIVNEYQGGDLKWRRLGLMKLNPIQKQIEKYMLECQSGFWPHDVNKAIAKAVNVLTKATYDLTKAPAVPLLDLTQGNHMVRAEDLSVVLPKGSYEPVRRVKIKA